MKENSDELELDSIIEAPIEGVENTVRISSTLDETEADLIEMPADPTEGDVLYEAAILGSTSDSMYNNVIKEMAEELSFMKASREAQYKANGNFSSISDKRMKGLKTLAELVSLKDKELSQSVGAEVDFNGEGFKNITHLMLMMVKRAMEDSNFDSQSIQTFFGKMNKELIGYEAKARKVYNGEKVENVLNEGPK
jgi:hypothetical protein